MTFLFLSIGLILAVYFFFTRNNNHWKNKNVPYLKPLPFFGNIINGIMMKLSFGEIFKELYEKSSEPVLGFFMLDQPCLLLKDPEIIKRVLITDFQHFFDRNILNNKRDDPVGTHNLFILKNPEWKQIRTKVTPVFSSSKIKTMSKLIEDVAVELTSYLEQKIRNNSTIEMKEVCVRYTVDVITSCAFGVRANSFKRKNPQFLVEAKRMTNWDDFMTSFRVRCYLVAHILVKIFRMKLVHPTSIKFLEQRFWEIMDQRAVSNNNRKDLIDILLQMKNDQEQFLERNILTSQVVVFFAAGFETSSSAMSFALYELALNPEIQTKLRKEINDVSKKHGDISYDSLKEMVYLDMCIKEVLRKYPVLPVLERKTNTMYTIPETGTVLEKGTPIFISTLALHNDPKYFPNPKKFDPERFSDKNKPSVENCTYLPFGEGPRNCIGARFGMMTVKFGLAHLLKEFALEACTKTAKDVTFNKNAFVLAALNGVWLKVTKI